MRLGERRRVRAPLWWRSKRRSVSGLLAILFVALLLASLSLYGLRALRPALETLAESQAQQLATLAANETVVQTLAESGVTYGDLVTLHVGEDGAVNAIQSNVVEINRLKSEIAIRLQQRIAALDTTQIAVPLGALSGAEWLSGVGPRIPVRLTPVGAATVELRHTFSDAGINQTRHSISADVSVEMGMLMTTVRKRVVVRTQLPIAETVIVGSVPETCVVVDGRRTDE